MTATFIELAAVTYQIPVIITEYDSIGRFYCKSRKVAVKHQKNWNHVLAITHG